MERSDIHHSANQLTAQYGDNASVEAALKAEAALAAGDLEQYHLWMQIGHVIEEMQAMAADQSINVRTPPL